MEETDVSKADIPLEEHFDEAKERDDGFEFPQSKVPKMLRSPENEKIEGASDDREAPVISITEPILDYTPPPFASSPADDVDRYGFDVIKNGTLIDRIDFAKRKAETFVVVGRLPSCDVHLQHPTISRHHCVLQYGDDLVNRTGKGWHIYDLGSTHGTKLNKKRIPPRQFTRIRVGHVMQFGGSSRIMTLFGPQSDVEAEWEYSPTEMKRMIEQKKLYDKIQKEKEEEALKNEKQSEGVMWGIDYDEELAYAQAHDEDDNVQDREEKYRHDPLKVLSRFFEKEGFDMEFKYDETGTGHSHKWTCSIELPVDTAIGQSLAASATCSGSKKEAQTLCAYNACRTLDNHGVLFRCSNAARRKARNLADNDFYDSDEDTYFDRTGQVEENREKRRQRALEAKGKAISEAETFETLTEKIASTSEEMNKVAAQLMAISREIKEKEHEERDDDDLDKYCRQLGQSSANADSIAVKTEKSILRQRLVSLKHEKERLEKLAKIARPVELPALRIPVRNEMGGSNTRVAGSLSAATNRKLMKIRRTKAPVPEEKERIAPVGMELPPDTFIRETALDTTSFVAENDDDEKPVTIGDGRASDRELELSRAAADPSDKKNPSKSELSRTGSSSPVLNASGKEQAVATVPSAVVIDENAGRRPMRSAAATDEERVCAAKHSRSATRKRVRARGETSVEREKQTAGDYGEGAVNREDDYVTWLPPANQKGDGTNVLNAKFAGRY